MDRTFGAKKIAGLVTFICLICASLIAPAADQDTAQNLLLKGRYEEARELFAEASETNPAAAIGLMRCHEEVGKRKKPPRKLRLP